MSLEALRDQSSAWSPLIRLCPDLGGIQPFTHVGHWTAAILPSGELAAGRIVRALGLSIRAHHGKR